MIELYNNNILIKEVEREDTFSDNGIYIPKENLDDEQVSKGIVVIDVDILKKGDIVMFHKALPVDVNMKLEGDKEVQTYFFINKKDLICKLK